MKCDLANAVSLLEIQEGSVYIPSSFLDFGILISLYYLYMHIIEHALTDERRMSEKEERCIRCDSWKEFQKITKDGFDLKVANTLDLLAPLQIQ